MIGDPFQDAVLYGLLLVELGGASAIAIVAGRRFGIPTAVAATTTWLVGVQSAGSAIGHLVAVVYTAQGGNYSYNFRYAALLLVGILITLAGAICLSALTELRSGRQPDWGRALRGTLLLLVITGPLVPVQPALAGGLTALGLVNLAVLGGRRLFAHDGARSPVAS